MLLRWSGLEARLKANTSAMEPIDVEDGRDIFMVSRVKGFPLKAPLSTFHRDVRCFASNAAFSSL